MKYITFTFDDGRVDNYEKALPITKKYDIPATLFCTTGYIDGTFRSEDWKSAPGPLTIQNLNELKEHGWEIALHGNCHTTQLQDTLLSIEKMECWGLGSDKYGFSIPNSNASQEDVIDIKNCGRISYIRKGRNIDTRALSSRILFGLYTYLKFKPAYIKFNLPNINPLPLNDPYNICSVVIRRRDNPDFIRDLINAIPDNTWTVLMFHSILPTTSEKYSADPWAFSTDSFERLCRMVNDLQDNNICKVVTMQDMV